MLTKIESGLYIDFDNIIQIISDIAIINQGERKRIIKILYKDTKYLASFPIEVGNKILDKLDKYLTSKNKVKLNEKNKQKRSKSIQTNKIRKNRAKRRSK